MMQHSQICIIKDKVLTELFWESTLLSTLPSILLYLPCCNSFVALPYLQNLCRNWPNFERSTLFLCCWSEHFFGPQQQLAAPWSTGRLWTSADLL